MLAHKGQFIALIVLIAIGIMSYVTFQNGYYNLKASLDHAYGRSASPTSPCASSACRSAPRAPSSARPASRPHACARSTTSDSSSRTGTRRPRASSAPRTAGAAVNARPRREGPLPSHRRAKRGRASARSSPRTPTPASAISSRCASAASDAPCASSASRRPREPLRHAERGHLPAPATFAVVYTTERPSSTSSAPRTRETTSP